MRKRNLVNRNHPSLDTGLVNLHREDAEVGLGPAHVSIFRERAPVGSQKRYRTRAAYLLSWESHDSCVRDKSAFLLDTWPSAISG